MANILIVEDDIDISQGIAEFLEDKDHALDFAYNGKQALSLLDDNQYDLVLLDINLPFVDGYDVCRSLLNNQLARMPVIIMSARSDETDILTGFSSGAWDYLVKPFSFAELSARINVNLAKTMGNKQDSTLYKFGAISLDANTLMLTYENENFQLHQVGFDILKLLITQAPDVVKTSTFHQTLWQGDTPDSDPLRAHVYKLRKQLNQHFGQSFIETVKSVGYRLHVE